MLLSEAMLLSIVNVTIKDHVDVHGLHCHTKLLCPSVGYAPSEGPCIVILMTMTHASAKGLDGVHDPFCGQELC